jgi:hypothetical protein
MTPAPGLLFRASEGRLVKTYGEINPWAREIAQRLLPAVSQDTPAASASVFPLP